MENSAINMRKRMAKLREAKGEKLPQLSKIKKSKETNLNKIKKMEANINKQVDKKISKLETRAARTKTAYQEDKIYEHIDKVKKDKEQMLNQLAQRKNKVEKIYSLKKELIKLQKL